MNSMKCSDICNSFAKTLIENHMVRYTSEQKMVFRDFIKEIADYYDLTYNDTPVQGNYNIILGDIDKADIILTAHYDTPKRNYCVPPPITFKRMTLSFLAKTLILFVPSIAILSLVSVLIMPQIITMVSHFILIIFSALILLLLAYNIFVFSIIKHPNTNNYNDNTSGIILLLEAMSNTVISDSIGITIAYVFFDNEEDKCKGSKEMKSIISNSKIIINFDCIGDGDDIIINCKKQETKVVKAIARAIDMIKQFYPQKRITLSTSIFAKRGSDCDSFKHSIGIMAFKRKCNILYLDKIHTLKDTALDLVNIQVLLEILIHSIPFLE